MGKLDMTKYVFGSFFLIANRLQVIGDKYLEKDNMTTKQWFLSVMIANFGENPPTVSEIAKLIGSSRQNVKQLALKLEEKEFLTIEKDKKDARALRLKLTDKCKVFWEKRQGQDDEFIDNLFNILSEEEIEIMYTAFNKLFEKVEELEKTLK